MKNLIENNKLIAKFMGAKDRNESRIKLNVNELWLPAHGVVRWDTIELGKGKTIHYHNSWDWLMPVVMHINTIEDYRYSVIIQTLDVRIWDNLHNKLIVDYFSYGGTDELLQSVYNSVVEFVKWYNNN